MKKKILTGGFLLAAVIVMMRVFSGFGSLSGAGLFCWEKDVLEEKDLREKLFFVMRQYHMDQLYQYIPAGMSPEELSPFFEAASREDVDVYLLTGAPEWAFDETGGKLRQALWQADDIRQRASGGDAVKGVMADVEPYLLEDWEDDPEAIMRSYVASMKTARQAADDSGLFLYACIPYYYDALDLTAFLNDLIQNGCHGVAVMNYYRDHEADHLSFECGLAKMYKKPLINIYELQAPGKYGLTEKNTYYSLGMKKVWESYRQLKRSLPFSGLSYAIHDYRALLEVEKIE